MRQNTKEIYSFFALQHKVLRHKLAVWAAAEKDNYDALEGADSAYALRGMVAFAEDTVKELKKLEAMVHAKVGIIYITAAAEGPLRTEYCTTTVTAVQIPELPKRSRDPDNYDKFMGWLQIPQELIEQDMVRLHWPNFQEWYNKRVAAGLPSPEGLDPTKVVATAKLKLRKKKDIEFQNEETPF